MIKIRVWFYTTIYIYTCIRILYKYFIYFQVKIFVILTMNFWKCLRAIYMYNKKKIHFNTNWRYKISSSIHKREGERISGPDIYVSPRGGGFFR